MPPVGLIRSLIRDLTNPFPPPPYPRKECKPVLRDSRKRKRPVTPLGYPCQPPSVLGAKANSGSDTERLWSLPSECTNCVAKHSRFATVSLPSETLAFREAVRTALQNTPVSHACPLAFASFWEVGPHRCHVSPVWCHLHSQPLSLEAFSGLLSLWEELHFFSALSPSVCQLLLNSFS